MSVASDLTFYLPVRDQAALLPTVVASIRAQTLQPGRILVVADSRSRDETVAMARRLGLEVIEQHDGRLGKSRNLALQAARTRYVASCDADVELAPDWLEALYGHRKDYVGIAGRTLERQVTPADAWRAINLPHHWGSVPIRNPFMLISEVLFDREALLTVGGYDERLHYNEDSDLSRRLRDAGFELLYEPSAQATHLRQDDVLSVLDLRWAYAEPRQEHRLSSFEGLLDKLPTNRDYAMGTLLRLLQQDRNELCYISVLLYFHHAMRDLAGLLRRRPMMGRPQIRAACECLSAVLCAATMEVDEPLAEPVAADLPAICELLGERATESAAPPIWERYLHSMGEGARRFVEELADDVRAAAVCSASYVHGRRSADRVPTIRRCTDWKIAEALAVEPLAPQLDRRQVERWREIVGNVSRLRCCGPVADVDRELLNVLSANDSTQAPGSELCACLNLQSEPRPIARLPAMLGDADWAIVGYRLPRRLLPGMYVVTPADLAETAARCGYAIERFSTLVGTTTLLLRRELADHPRSDSLALARAMA
jgi:glycosyltransferase involved in cell wall biosynthesis